jgi:hypothetical protein
MFKLISLLLAAIPVFLFLRAVLGRSTTAKRAVSDFRRRVDYLVWVMLVLIAVGLVYSVVSYMSLWLHPPSLGMSKSGEAFRSFPVGHLASV